MKKNVYTFFILQYHFCFWFTLEDEGILFFLKAII